MLDGPFIAGTKIPLTETECIDLLFNLLQRHFVVISHSEVFLNGDIFICRNMNRVIATIGKALRNHHSITLIGFDPFSLLCQHRCRCQNRAFDSGFGQLVIK